MVFTGYYEHSIDEKNRLAIPAKFRARMDRDRDGIGFFIAPGQPRTTLWLYAERQFERIAEQASSTFTPETDQLEWEQMFYTLAEHVEPDTQGRVIIPPRMLAATGLGREVVICGVRDHLEIRRRDEFDKGLDENWGRYHECFTRVREAQRRGMRPTDPLGR
jgi:MraZ protein